MSKWYGNLDNRIMENARQPEEIVVGMGATEIFYSDRHAYEIIEVKDQKHITVRQLKATSNGAYSNNWTLERDEEATPIELTKRATGWYTAWTITREDLESIGAYKDERGLWTCDDKDNLRILWNWAMHNIDFDKVWEKGKQSRYHKRNFIIGVADEYFDYEF